MLGVGTETKTCTACQEQLPLAMFSKAGQAGRLRPQCKPCTRAIEKSQFLARRAAEGEPPETRKCSACGVEHKLTKEFFKPDKGRKYGFTNECKKCLGKRNLAWVRTERGQKTSRAWRLKNHARVRVLALQSQKRRRQKVNAYLAAYRLRNLERERKRDREYARANRPRNAASRHKRRAAGSVSAESIQTLLVVQRHNCAACRKKLTATWEVDHILPVALGGTSDPENLQILCRYCNRSKGAKHPVDFMQRLGFLL